MTATPSAAPLHADAATVKTDEAMNTADAAIASTTGNARRTVIVAGDIGPTSKTASMSADVNNPAARDVTFADLYATYREQVRGLADGGVDVFLIETTFDTLNVKAAIKAIRDTADERHHDYPIMISGTLSDASGRTLSGQTVEAFVASVMHADPISIGLNCGFGATQLLPWIENIAAVATCAVSVHPNAGLPNVMGEYEETPELFATHSEQYFRSRLVNIYGGCCGTTPDHIRRMAAVAKGYSPRPLRATTADVSPTGTASVCPTKADASPTTASVSPTGTASVCPTKADASPTGTANICPTEGGRGASPALPCCTLSGLEPLRLDGSIPFVNIGERTNVAGSAKFKRLIKEKHYEEALSVARQQVENGAQVIDICMDDGMIDGVDAMRTFLNLIASEPEIARVPVMIDSSKWDILVAGLECVQGKSIVNSISLKEGESAFLTKAHHIHAMGAAAVVMLFDETGQADTYERKVSVARRAYKLLKTNGFPTEDIIFDPNVLAVATGMAEHDDYARAFIEACRTIRREMPEVHMSGGISNLSFSFRGNNTIRQAMHSVFLYHAMRAGLDMSIVNPAMTTVYSEIPGDMLRAVEDVILNTDAGAAERLIDFAQRWKEHEDEQREGQPTGTTTSVATDWRTLPLNERIDHAMLHGITDHIADDAEEAYQAEGTALGVIDHYLMPAMEHVGELFGEGKMFLPQVVKSARVMKKAVARIEPYMTSATPSATEKSGGGLVVMATVKGDVHDIGKNIVGVVIQCNGYEVRDLGVMVDPRVIVDTAVETQAICIGLSGLITPSLEEMIHVVQELERRHLTIPVMVGGATTSELHTAVKIAPEYPHGAVFHCRAAADNPGILRRLVASDREEYIRRHKERQQEQREEYAREEAAKRPPLTLEQARQRRQHKDAAMIAVASDAQRVLLSTDNHSLRHPSGACLCCDPLVPLINWHYFFSAWGMKGHFPELLSDPEKGAEASRLYHDAQQMLSKILRQRLLRLQMKAQILPAVSVDDDIIITDQRGREHRLTMPRSLRDEAVTQCLADHILSREESRGPDGTVLTDYVMPFVVSAGVGLHDLQTACRTDGDEYHAIMAKLLADRLTEAMAEKLSHDVQTTVGWGSSLLRVAFGYPTCPDHSLKRQVFDILDITPDNSGLTITENNMIAPGETICGLIFANTPTRYFVV